MSKRSETVAAETCVALGASDARVTSYSNREVTLGALAVSRALPIKDRRLVGPWCFLDRFGPLTFAADLQVHAGHELAVPLQPDFEHAFLVLSGDARLADQTLEERVLYYLGTTRSEAHISSRDGCRLLLIDGPPFPEQILMWWNFVARTEEDIAQARTDWEDHHRFGDVAAYQGPRVTAPSLGRFARPNPVS